MLSHPGGSLEMRLVEKGFACGALSLSLSLRGEGQGTAGTPISSTPLCSIPSSSHPPSLPPPPPSCAHTLSGQCWPSAWMVCSVSSFSCLPPLCSGHTDPPSSTPLRPVRMTRCPLLLTLGHLWDPWSPSARPPARSLNCLRCFRALRVS